MPVVQSIVSFQIDENELDKYHFWEMLICVKMLEIVYIWEQENMHDNIFV